MVIVVASIMNFFSIIVSSVPFMILEFQLLNLLITELMSGEGTHPVTHFFWVEHCGLFVHLFNLPNATEVCHAWTVWLLLATPFFPPNSKF